MFAKSAAVSVKELTKICSKTSNENGTHRNNYYTKISSKTYNENGTHRNNYDTKITKDELVKQMNAIYD